MKTNYKSMAKRYELADQYILATLPAWKRATVIECRKLKEASRILDEFAQSVASLAEDFTKTISVKNKIVTVSEKAVAKSKKPVTV
jgi:hypothetical protein